jgi:hypothetical protein
MLPVNTVRHPAAPTEADVAFNNMIRSVCGQAICAGLWPRDRLVEGMRLTERLDDAIRRGDVFDAISAGDELFSLARIHAPETVASLSPKRRRAA